jgi:hypothetical protein
MSTNHHQTRLGLRQQSVAATALSSGRAGLEPENASRAYESGVALSFPPQSKTRSVFAQLPDECRVCYPSPSTLRLSR